MSLTEAETAKSTKIITHLKRRSPRRAAASLLLKELSGLQVSAQLPKLSLEEVENAADVEVARVRSLEEVDLVMEDTTKVRKELRNSNKLQRLRF
jgi:hypothetical protein